MTRLLVILRLKVRQTLCRLLTRHADRMFSRRQGAVVCQRCGWQSAGLGPRNNPPVPKFAGDPARHRLPVVGRVPVTIVDCSDEFFKNFQPKPAGDDWRGNRKLH